MFRCRRASQESSLQIPVALQANQHAQSLSHQLQWFFCVPRGGQSGREGNSITVNLTQQLAPFIAGHKIKTVSFARSGLSVILFLF